jgi:hypothetical protein
MRNLSFGEAIDDALASAMATDSRIILIGEDVRLMHNSLFLRFGAKRVRETPISESAFLGAGVAAAIAGLRPVVEIMMADFLGVAMDALLNQAAKLEAFSGGRWRFPPPPPTRASALGSGGRKNVQFDVPAEGARGPVPRVWKPLPLGQAELRHSAARGPEAPRCAGRSARRA